MISCCIFDLDGVIVDTAKHHYIAWKQVAKELNFDFTPEQNERLKGVSRMASLDILLSIGNITVSQEDKEWLANHKNSQYLKLIEKLTPTDLLPGAADLLVELRKYGIKTALGSASKNAGLILNRLQIEHLFDVVVDGNMVSKAKPDPEVFVLGADLLKVEHQQCIVFEDAEAGVEAALAAGMFCVGIGSAKTLYKAHRVIKDLSEIDYTTIVSFDKQ